MIKFTWFRIVSIAIALAALELPARPAETNAPAPGALPPTEFPLTSQVPAAEPRRAQPLPDSVRQSNTVRLLQHRAALLQDLRSRSLTNTSGSASMVQSNRVMHFQARLEDLRRKKADGTLAPDEQRQLQQLELMAARTAKTNPPVKSTLAPAAPAGAEQK
jgi:hypothetical protein